METVFTMCFLLIAIYCIKDREKVILLIALNYLATLLMQWYGFDFGINILFMMAYPLDILNALLLFLLLLSVLKSKKIVLRKSIIYINFLCFTSIIFCQAILGFLTYGASADFFGDFRKFSGVIIPILYFSQNPIEFDSIYSKNVIRYTMNGIVAFCYIYWLLYWTIGYDFGAVEASMRCFHSDAATIVALYTIYLIYDDIVNKNTMSLRTIIFIIAIILLQHNSVYMVLMSGTVIILFYYREKIFGKKKFLFEILLLSFTVICIGVIFSGSEISKNLLKTFSKFGEARTSGEGTIGTRYAIWGAAISSLKNPLEWIFGKSLGSGYHVRYLGNAWAASPHSGYIECLMRSGILGAITFFGTILGTIIINLKKKKILNVALIIAILFYWFPYSYTIEVSALLGTIMTYKSARNKIIKN